MVSRPFGALTFSLGSPAGSLEVRYFSVITVRRTGGWGAHLQFGQSSRQFGAPHLNTQCRYNDYILVYCVLGVDSLTSLTRVPHLPASSVPRWQSSRLDRLRELSGSGDRISSSPLGASLLGATCGLWSKKMLEWASHNNNKICDILVVAF
ncbi:hypothetical protein RRG08_066464 [Elysia crispata]|uniref:Uncharacterized protein n=1 Tax=Elysia crispata TaxID=231223 RepID=A0AAE1DI84_9GAST|nr:hypothetical protein RRG08_066464 [Elysia crispata]